MTIQTAAAIMGRKGGKFKGPAKSKSARKAALEKWRRWRLKKAQDY